MNIHAPHWFLIVFMACLPPFWMSIGWIAHSLAKPTRRVVRLLGIIKWRGYRIKRLGVELEYAAERIRDLEARLAVHDQETIKRIVGGSHG